MKTLLILGGCLFLSVATHGATRTWSVTSTSEVWSDPANWGGTAPAANDDLLFPPSAVLITTTNDLPSGTPLHSITLEGPASAYRFDGNLVELGAGGLTEGSAGTPLAQTDIDINIPIRLGATQQWTINHAGVRVNADLQLNGMAIGMATSAYTPLTGVISGTGVITCSGVGWALKGHNTFRGRFVLASNGLLSVTTTDAFGVADGTEANGMVIYGGLFLSGIDIPNEHITLFGQSSSGSPSIKAIGGSFAGTIQLGNNYASVAGSPILLGLVTGPGSLLVGSGPVVLSHAGNDFAGNVGFWHDSLDGYTLGSTVRLDADSAIPPTASVSLSSGAYPSHYYAYHDTLDLNGHKQELVSVSGGGAINFGDGGVLTLSNPTASAFCCLTGTGTIILKGGTWTSAGSRFTLINKGGQMTLTGAVQLFSQTAGTAVLAKGMLIITTATITGGAVRYAQGALPTFGDLKLAPAVTYREEIDDAGTFSKALVGTVDFHDAILTFDGNATGLKPGDSIMMIDNDGTDPVNGTFSGWSEGHQERGAGGLNYAISYHGGDGNDVVLTVVAAIPALDWQGLVLLAAALAMVGALLQHRIAG